MARPPPKVITEKNENYKTIIQSGIYGGHRAGVFEYVVYTDEIIADEALSTIPPDSGKIQIKRTLQCTIHLTPFEALNLVQWLTQHISEYEKMFGKITGKEQSNRKKQPPSTMIS